MHLSRNISDDYGFSYIRIFAYLLIVVISCVLFADAALAQTPPPVTAADTNFQGIQDRFRTVTTAWMGAIQAFAIRLFYILMTIDLLWLFIKIVLTGSDMTKVVAELSKRVIIFGLFIFLIQNNGFVPEIIAGFVQLSQEMVSAGGGTPIAGGVQPGDVFALGLRTAGDVSFDVGLFDVGTALFLLLASAFIVICFALIAARLMLAFIETYFVSVIGVFMLAFGGLEQSRQLAQKFIFYAISAGVKLFLMLMIVGVAQQVILDITAGFQWTTTFEAYIMMGVSVVSLILAGKVPEMAQSIINGVSAGNSGGLMGAAMIGAGVVAGGAVAAGAAAGAGGGAAAGGASSGAGGAASPAGKALSASMQAGQALGSSGSGGGGGGGEAPLPPPPPSK